MIEISEPLEEYKEAKKFSGISEKLAVQIGIWRPIKI